MMKCNVRRMTSNLYVLVLISILFPLGAHSANWSNLEEVIVGTWGSQPQQFGLYRGDTIAYDEYPELLKLVIEKKLFINDDVNKRGLVYTTNGQFLETVSIQKTIEGEFEVFRWSKYYYDGIFVGFGFNNTFWTEDEGTFRKYDSTFNLIQTTSTRPLELGKITKTGSGAQWHYEVEYPEGIYIYDGPRDMLSEREVIRINTNLIMQNFEKKVYAYKVVEEIPVAEGEKKRYRINKVAEWLKPKDDLIFHKDPDDKTIGGEYEIVAQYGEAVIGPDGSIYTWMRSETQYKILRWRWVEQ